MNTLKKYYEHSQQGTPAEVKPNEETSQKIKYYTLPKNNSDGK